MYYELYIDVFFLENFMMDSIILLLVNRFLKLGSRKGRIFLGAAAGSLMTCGIVLLPLPDVPELLICHLAVSSIMLAAGLRIRSMSGFFRAFILLYACAAVSGGIMYVLRPYLRFAGLFYGAAAVSYLVIKSLWKAVSRLNRGAGQTVSVTLYGEQETMEVKALIDTGNRLRDYVSGEPVSVLSPDAAGRMTGGAGTESGFRLLPYHCVDGSSMMKIFRLRRICVHMEADYWVEHPLVGIAEKSFSGEEFEMILNPSVLSE